eukprot:6490831-Amphidinium_carterae.2
MSCCNEEYLCKLTALTHPNRKPRDATTSAAAASSLQALAGNLVDVGSASPIKDQANSVLVRCKGP